MPLERLQEGKTNNKISEKDHFLAHVQEEKNKQL